MNCRKWAGLLLGWIMVFVLAVAAAEEPVPGEIRSGDWIYLRYGDTAAVIRYTGNETEVTIPDTLDGLPVVALGRKNGGDKIFTDENRERVVTVHIPESVLLIGENAFFNCVNLTGVNIPERIMTIQRFSFFRTGLKSIRLPEGLRTIEVCAFAHSALEEITLPASVQWINDGAFEGCTALKEIAWPNDGVYLGRDAFRETGIPEEAFSLPGQYAENDYTNRYFFYSPAETMGTIELANQVTASYIRKPDGTIGILHVRVGEGASKKLTVPDRIEGLPVSGYYGTMDDSSNVLESLTFPDSITEIGDLALNHLNVKSLILPRHLIRIGHEALQYCGNLQTVKLPGTLRKIGYSSFLHSGTDTTSFMDDLKRQVSALGIEQEYRASLGSVGCPDDYDVNLDGMICEIESIRDENRMELLCWKLDPLCSLRESPDNWLGIPFAEDQRDSVRIRAGIAYRRDWQEAFLRPEQITDATGWDWTFPETVDDLPVVQDKDRAIMFMQDGLLCELRTDNGKQEVRILQADAAAWDGVIPETISGKPVLWLGEEVILREDGLMYCGVPYEERALAVIGCERQEEVITLPASVQGWNVIQVNSGAFTGLNSLRKVILPVSVKSLYDGSFQDCPALTEIEAQRQDIGISPDAFQHLGLKWMEIQGTCYSTAMPQGNGDYALFSDGTAEIRHWPVEGNSLKLPAEADGHPVVAIADYTFRGSVLTSVELPSGVIRIGKEAFYNCEMLASVKLSDTLEYIGDYAFSSCEKLKSIQFPSSLSHLGRNAFSFTGISAAALPEGMEEVPDRAFEYCTQLSKVTLPKSLKSIGEEAFRACRALNSISLPENLETIGAKCFQESGLKKITIPASVRSIGDNCFRYYLEDPGWGNLYYAGPEVVFDGDPEVTGQLFGLLADNLQFSYTEFWDRTKMYIGHKIVKLKITTSPGTMVDRLFLSPVVVDKSYPPEKEMSSGDTPAVETLHASDIPQGIQILTIPEGVRRIASGAFSGMHSLYRVILPDSLEEIEENAFENCGGLQYVTMGAGLKRIGKRAFAECRNLREISLPEGVQEIPEECFDRDINLKKAVLPAGLTAIRDKAFHQCCYLEEANLQECTGLESIGDMAFYQSAMKKITLPDSVRILGDQAFAYPIDMTALKLSAGLEEIPEGCFYHCSHLKTLEINEGIRSIGENAFYQARDMQNLKLPEGLEIIGKGAFSTFVDNVMVYNAHGRRYSSLKSVKLPASVHTLGIGAFAGCDAITSVTFAEGSALSEIPDMCFLLCTALKKMQIPAYIQKVGVQAFAGCTVLSQMTVSEGTSSLGAQAFEYCTNLQNLELPASLTEIGGDLLENASTNVTVSVEDGSAAALYMQANYPEVKTRIRTGK